MIASLRIILCALLLAAMSFSAHATVFNFVPSDADLADLDHNYAYSWGIRNSTLQVEPLPTPSGEGRPDANACPP